MDENSIIVANKYGSITAQGSVHTLAAKRGRSGKNDIKKGDFQGRWSDDARFYYGSLPGGGVFKFNLDNLTNYDFHMMEDDPQIAASLSVLTFMVHQADYEVKCKSKEIKDEMTQQMQEHLWVEGLHAMSQAFTFGYSPVCYVFGDNDRGYTTVDEFKDLTVDSCKPYTLPEFADKDTPKHYAGIKQGDKVINPIYTMWYSLQPRNGSYYGKKLLRPAFVPYFFSQLIHLFANRYFERFGEPTLIGRAPKNETITMGGTTMKAADFVVEKLNNIRNHSSVVFDSEKDEKGDYLYDIKVLESQMRGADFERYMDRLDEEKSLALFTPVLLFRTTDTGSYDLGVQHYKMFSLMLNWLISDVAKNISRHLLTRLAKINWGENAPDVWLQPKKLGRITEESARAVLQALIQNGAAKLSDGGLKELGDYLGLTLEQIQVLAPQAAPAPAPAPATKKPALKKVAASALTEQEYKSVSDILDKISRISQDAYTEGKNERFRLPLRGKFVDRFPSGQRKKANDYFDAVQEAVNEAQSLQDIQEIFT